MTHLTAAIDLINPGTVEQLHVGVFRPAVVTLAGTIDGGQIALRLVRPYGRRDVHIGEDGASLAVVATVDGAGHHGVLTRIPIVHVRLDDVAGRQNFQTVGTAKDILYLDGGLRRHIDHRAGGVTLSVAAAVSITDFTVQQIDDG